MWHELCSPNECGTMELILDFKNSGFPLSILSYSITKAFCITTTTEQQHNIFYLHKVGFKANIAYGAM